MNLLWDLSSNHTWRLLKRSLLNPFISFGNDSTIQKVSSAAQGRKGHVYLIGAGPGDAELLTLKAVRLMQEADVVLYDWLVSEEILSLIPATTEKLFVGKRAGKHSMKQEVICDLLCEQASAGKRVVRLKGGDPAIFGRLGEECMALEQRGIAFAVVPGVTAASGMSAYTGTPLTDRRCSQSVRLITAQFKKPELEPDWASMAPRIGERSKETLVFYMGLSRVYLICQRLIEHGLPVDTPAMLVDQATTAQQETLTRTLQELPLAMQKREFKGPALLVVGDVINYRHAIDLALLSRATSYV
jgi:uroporphyrin-III C-methyltransferase